MRKDLGKHEEHAKGEEHPDDPLLRIVLIKINTGGSKDHPPSKVEHWVEEFGGVVTSQSHWPLHEQEKFLDRLFLLSLSFCSNSKGEGKGEVHIGQVDSQHHEDDVGCHF